MLAPFIFFPYDTYWSRGVAQLARAPALGAGGREFKSRRPDQIKSSSLLRQPLADYGGQAVGSSPPPRTSNLKKACCRLYLGAGGREFTIAIKQVSS